jgi:hypothetical protein
MVLPFQSSSSVLCFRLPIGVGNQAEQQAKALPSSSRSSCWNGLGQNLPFSGASSPLLVPESRKPVSPSLASPRSTRNHTDRRIRTHQDQNFSPNPTIMHHPKNRHRHPGLDPGPTFLSSKRATWIPDQVRDDRIKTLTAIAFYEPHQSFNPAQANRQ